MFVTMAAGAALGMAATPAAAHDHFDGYHGFDADVHRDGEFFKSFDHKGGYYDDHGHSGDHGDHHWWDD
ncbi:hypothetical protein BJF83_16855 [Nocardiopsis sp. CNR-923]|nr:hypothetical protein BJF83_16855 [Nocardiopsis sp. CNR-923]